MKDNSLLIIQITKGVYMEFQNDDLYEKYIRPQLSVERYYQYMQWLEDINKRQKINEAQKNIRTKQNRYSNQNNFKFRIYDEN